MFQVNEGIKTKKEKHRQMVSIITPTYNRSTFLTKAIRSVLAQTYTYWELIVVDDGSTDETKRVIGDFLKKDDRIIYVYQKNSGMPAIAKNTGIKIANGDFIAFLDSDDEWLPEKLEKQISFFSANPDVVLLGTCAVVVDDAGFAKYDTLPLENDIDIRNNLLIKNEFISSSVVVSARALRLAGNFRGILLGEDYDLWLRIGMFGKMHNLQEFLVHYTEHGGNISGNMLKNLRSRREITSLYKKSYPNFFKARFIDWMRFIYYRLPLVRNARLFLKKSF